MKETSWERRRLWGILWEIIYRKFEMNKRLLIEGEGVTQHIFENY